MPDMLTISEVSEHLRVSDRTVSNWIKTNQLKAYKLGGAFRIKREDFEEFLESSLLKNEEKEV